MQLPIDTAHLTLLAGRVEPVIDFETRQPRADANGEPVYGVDVVALGAEAPQIWPVKVTGLIATPWSRDGCRGIAFRAEAITPVAVAQKAAA
jgi:hypothetical protein